jgi:lipopolysaccharide biosynthesis protein
MIHCFYPDLLEGMLKHLRPLRRCATIMVSVCDPDHEPIVDGLVTKVLGRDTARTVKVVPNRGRNFAPLLCSFGADIAEHEFLLHLHTKKSLYIGYERSDWRGHLLLSLAGRSVRPILGVFACWQFRGPSTRCQIASGA